MAKKVKEPEKVPEKVECGGCGKENPTRLKECPRCGSDKCEQCDMGDDVECGNCPTDDEDEDE